MNAGVHKKVLVLFQESFNATTIFLQLRHFLLDAFYEVRVRPIKSKFSCMALNAAVIYHPSWTDQFLGNSKPHVVFQPTSEQAKYGASDILKRNRKGFAVFFENFSLNRSFVLILFAVAS